MTDHASIGKPVLIDIDGVPTHAVVTHVHGAHENGSTVVDLSAFPREAPMRTFAGVNLHPDAESAGDDEHNLTAYYPTGDEGVTDEPDDDGDQGDEPAAAPARVQAKKAPAKKAPARR